MKNLIEKIKSFFLPKKEEPELCYEEILYSDYIDALTEFSKPLGINYKKIRSNTKYTKLFRYW